MSGAVTAWAVIPSPTDPEMWAVHGAYLVADRLPIEDAHLIAAAPELYEALEAMRQRWDLYTGGIGGAGHTDDRLMQLADHALSKARGE